MERPIAVIAAFVVSLSLAAGAEGKVMLKSAKVCGQSGCATQTARAGDDLPFEIFGPVIEAGRRVTPPAQPTGPRFEVVLTTRPAPGSETASVDYFPDPGYIRIDGRRGDEAGGALLNVGWVLLATAERKAYDALVFGATPFGAEGQSNNADDGLPAIVVGLVIALSFASLAFILFFRRRPAQRLRLQRNP